MKIQKLYTTQKTLAQMLLLVLPMAVIGSYILWYVNQYYTVLNNQWVSQSIFLALGLFTGCFFYNYRFRFISTFVPLVLLLYILSKIIEKVFTGEFSGFYAITQFYIFSFLFVIGWLIGWGFARFRYFPVFLSAALLVLQITIVSKTTEITSDKLILALAPVLLFALYIIYTAELIRNMNDDQPAFGWFLTRKLGGFTVISMAILLLIFLFFKQDFKSLERDFGSGSEKQNKENNKESLTKKNKDGSVSNNKEMGLSGGRKKTKELLFIAKLDNYFPNTDNPNPLYFTYDYFSKFDTLTQTLETDSLMPSYDLFQPDPSQIPLYFTQSDSSVLTRAKGTLRRKVVTTEVYKSLLSAKDFLAPSTAFFCQPIAVDKEFKSQFKSAYRAKMYVSDLNSAYFIYNPAGNDQLKQFQEQRFNELRKVSDWNKEDTAFMHYFTFMPGGAEYDSIRLLARQITRNATTPVDKIIAVRNFFTSKDENGQPLYKYTDNPGVPGLPSANKLTYFLFQNRKGYCAYFAGATLFLLRSLGIPTRVSTGFLTVDRADKNKGWYWFYADQAHAWVQVFFPGYGWIDFDTTIPDTETQHAPQPDGTPPITVQSAYLVASGKVTLNDTPRKRMQMLVTKFIYHDKEFNTAHPFTLNMDVSLATVSRDTGDVPLSAVKTGNDITALSFSEQFKNLLPTEKDSLSDIVKRLPDPAPIDEIKIIDKEKQARKTATEKKPAPHNLWWLVRIFVIAFALVLLAIFLTPWIIYRYYRSRAIASKGIKEKAYWSYNASMYLLNQYGWARAFVTPLQFAKTTIDPMFGTRMVPFIEVYLKTKYAPGQVTETESNIIREYFLPFEKAVNKKVAFKTRFNGFLNIYRTLHYFTKPKI